MCENDNSRMLEKDPISTKLVIRLLYIIEIFKLDIFDQKKYINFIEMCRKAYPDLQKEKHRLVVVGGGLM